MKRSVLVIMICVACSTIGVAQDDVPLLDSIVQYYYVEGNDSTPAWRWEYQYNSAGQEISHGIYNRKDSHWNLFEKQENIFNEKGDTIEKIEHHTLEHGLHYPYVKHEWEYDKHGNLLNHWGVLIVK